MLDTAKIRHSGSCLYIIYITISYHRCSPFILENTEYWEKVRKSFAQDQGSIRFKNEVRPCKTPAPYEIPAIEKPFIVSVTHIWGLMKQKWGSPEFWSMIVKAVWSGS